MEKNDQRKYLEDKLLRKEGRKYRRTGDLVVESLKGYGRKDGREMKR